MICKLIGSLAVLGAAAVFVLRGGAAMRERIAQLEEFILLLRHIREEIACFRTPTPEILAGFHGSALERIGFLQAAKEGDLRTALQATAHRLYLDGEELAVLHEFAAGLGRGYVSEELARCELAISRLTAALSARREALPRTARLFRTLVISGACAVILVLI